MAPLDVVHGEGGQAYEEQDDAEDDEEECPEGWEVGVAADAEDAEQADVVCWVVVFSVEEDLAVSDICHAP